MKNLYFILFFFLLLSSCTSSEDEEGFSTPFPIEKLQGTWELEALTSTPGTTTGTLIFFPSKSEELEYQISLEEIEGYRITFENNGFLSTEGYYSINNNFIFDGQEIMEGPIENGGASLRSFEAKDNTIFIDGDLPIFTDDYLIDEVIPNEKLTLTREVSTIFSLSEADASLCVGIGEYCIDEFDIAVPLVLTGGNATETTVWKFISAEELALEEEELEEEL